MRLDRTKYQIHTGLLNIIHNMYNTVVFYGSHAIASGLSAVFVAVQEISRAHKNGC